MSQQEQLELRKLTMEVEEIKEQIQHYENELRKIANVLENIAKIARRLFPEGKWDADTTDDEGKPKIRLYGKYIPHSDNDIRNAMEEIKRLQSELFDAERALQRRGI